MTLLLTWQSVHVIPPELGLTEDPIVPQVVQVENPRESTEPQTSPPSPIIKGSQTPLAESPYGEIFNKESEELPFYLMPQFDGLDASDHRRQIRPNSAGQRLDMDQYNKQVRPSVGP